jgi:putative transposase
MHPPFGGYPEFIAGELKQLLEEAGVSSYFIDPGSPWQNGRVPSGCESFHSHLRDELLNREAFATLTEIRHRLASHRLWYNQERIHSSLDYITPEECYQLWLEQNQSDTQHETERKKEAASPPEEPEAITAEMTTED